MHQNLWESSKYGRYLKSEENHPGRFKETEQWATVRQGRETHEDDREIIFRELEK